MSDRRIDFGTLPATGRVALIDLVQSPSHEARLAYAALLKSVVDRVGGRVAWGGSIDQQLIGHADGHYGDILISEYPSPEACARALAERQEWKPESFVTEQETYSAAPWSGPTRLVSRIMLGGLALLGRGARPADLSVSKEQMWSRLPHGDPAFGPTPEQLGDLIENESTGRVVMVNFLEYRETADYSGTASGTTPGTASGTKSGAVDPQSPISGRAAYRRYGKVTVPLIARAGGRIRWACGRTRPLEPAQGGWHEMAIVEYPSRAAFLGMLQSSDYQAVTVHRDAGLLRTHLLVCTSHAEFF